MASVLVWVAAAASMVFAASCSLVIDPDQVQCNVPADCVARGLGDLDCIGSICQGDPVLGCKERPWASSSVGEPLDVSITVSNLLPGDLAPGVELKACTALDTRCMTPLGAPGVSNASGVATLRVHQGFRGHYATSGSSEYAPYILHMNPPPDLDRPTTLKSNMVVTNMATLVGLATGIVVVDPLLAHFFFSTRDCQGRLMAGVSVVIEEDASMDPTTAYLTTDGTVGISLTESSASGQGAIVNITGGQTHKISGFLSGEQIFEQEMVFEAGTITTAQIVPTQL